MRAIIRIEAATDEPQVRAFLDGVTAALIASNTRVVVSNSSTPHLDIEFSLASKHLARRLAKSIATILEPHSADARVTLAVDARELEGIL
jgi:hypothetical protein